MKKIAKPVLPYSTHGGSGFAEKQEMKDLEAMLAEEITVNPLITTTISTHYQTLSKQKFFFRQRSAHTLGRALNKLEKVVTRYG